MRLTNGNPTGDSYAVSITVPCTYGPGMKEVVYTRNVRAHSAQEAADLLPEVQDRIVAVWPERF
jgi:hypothetical protein